MQFADSDAQQDVEAPNLLTAIAGELVSELFLLSEKPVTGFASPQNAVDLGWPTCSNASTSGTGTACPSASLAAEKVLDHSQSNNFIKRQNMTGIAQLAALALHGECGYASAEQMHGYAFEHKPCASQRSNSNSCPRRQLESEACGDRHVHSAHASLRVEASAGDTVNDRLGERLVATVNRTGQAETGAIQHLFSAGAGAALPRRSSPGGPEPVPQDKIHRSARSSSPCQASPVLRMDHFAEQDSQLPCSTAAAKSSQRSRAHSPANNQDPPGCPHGFGDTSHQRKSRSTFSDSSDAMHGYHFVVQRDGISAHNVAERSSWRLQPPVSDVRNQTASREQRTMQNPYAACARRGTSPLRAVHGTKASSCAPSSRLQSLQPQTRQAPIPGNSRPLSNSAASRRRWQF